MTVTEWTPAVAGDDFLVMDASVLPGGLTRPTGLLVTGDRADPAALRKAVGGGARVVLRSEELASFVDSPLQSGAERVYAAAVAAGTGYAVLALLLTLLRAAPERAALLARLRTMGLTRAQGRAAGCSSWSRCRRRCSPRSAAPSPPGPRSGCWRPAST